MEGLAAGTYGTGGHAIPAQGWPKATATTTEQWPGQTSNGAAVVAWLISTVATEAPERPSSSGVQCNGILGHPPMAQ